MPTTLKCKICGAVWLRHSTIPDTFGMAGDKYYVGKTNYYVATYNRLKGKCPGCGREMPDPAGFKDRMGVRVVDARLPAEEQERLRMATGGRNAFNWGRRKK